MSVTDNYFIHSEGQLLQYRICYNAKQFAQRTAVTNLHIFWDSAWYCKSRKHLLASFNLMWILMSQSQRK